MSGIHYKNVKKARELREKYYPESSLLSDEQILSIYLKEVQPDSIDAETEEAYASMFDNEPGEPQNEVQPPTPEKTDKEIIAEIHKDIFHPTPAAAKEEDTVGGEWTKGEWTAHKVSDGWVIKEKGLFEKGYSDRIAELYEYNAEANALRIVTCVNGYDSLLNQLNSESQYSYLLKQENDKLKADNASLVSALKDMIELYGSRDKYLEPYKTSIENAKALINQIEANNN